MNPRRCSHLSAWFRSFSFSPARYRSELFLYGAAVLLCFLVAGGRTAVAQLSTGSAPVLLSIAVTPTDALIFPDRRQQFTATGTFSDGHTHDVTRRVKWSSSVLDVATVSRDGVAWTVGDGQTTIQASLGLVDGSTTLTVSRFVWTGSMKTERTYHTATLLDNGLVLLAAGQGPNGEWLASAELHNPATGNSIYTTGSMNIARSGQTATLLDNGMVLLAGGVDA